MSFKTLYVIILFALFSVLIAKPQIIKINKTKNSKEVKKEIKRVIDANNGNNFSNYKSKELNFSLTSLRLISSKLIFS